MLKKSNNSHFCHLFTIDSYGIGPRFYWICQPIASHRHFCQYDSKSSARKQTYGFAIGGNP